MGGDVTSTISNIAGRGVGVLAALTSLRGGGLGAHLRAQQEAITEPARRAALLESPFMAGFYGLGGGRFAGTPEPGVPELLLAQPGDWAPDLPPLSPEKLFAAVKTIRTQEQLASSDVFTRARAKLAAQLPLDLDEQQAMLTGAQQLVRTGGPGTQARVTVPGLGSVTYGAPTIAQPGMFEYPTRAQAEDAAQATGQVVVPTSRGLFAITPPRGAEAERPALLEYADQETAEQVAGQTGGVAVPSRGGTTWAVVPRQQPPQPLVSPEAFFQAFGIPPPGSTVAPPSVFAPTPAAGGVAPPPPRAAPRARPTPAAAPSTVPTPIAAPPLPAPAAVVPAPAPGEQLGETPAPPELLAPAPAAPPAPPVLPPHRLLRRTPEGALVPVTPAPAPAPAVAPEPQAAVPAAPAPVGGLAERGVPERVEVAPSGVPYRIVTAPELPGGVAGGASPAFLPGVTTTPTTTPASPRALPWTPRPAGAPATTTTTPVVGAPPTTLPAVAGPGAFVPRRFTAQAKTTAGPVTIGGEIAGGPPRETQATRGTLRDALYLRELGVQDVKSSPPGTAEALASFQREYDRRDAEVRADVERRYAKPEDQDVLAGLLMYRGFVNDLLREFPRVEDRTQYFGAAGLRPYGYAAIQRFADDPQYARFAALNAALRASLFSDAGKATSRFEIALLEPTLPNLFAASPSQYEQAVRLTTEKLDRLITARDAFANLRAEDRTPANMQALLTRALSGPESPHYGPFPWGREQERSGPPKDPSLLVDELYVLPRVEPQAGAAP